MPRRRRAVVHAAPHEGRDSGRVSRRYDTPVATISARLDLAAAAEDHRPDRPAGLEPDDVACQDRLRAEAGSLGHRPMGQVGWRAREAEVVLDRGALTRLTTRGVALDDYRRETL